MKRRKFPWTRKPDSEGDLLRLAILKEKASYREFWKHHGENAKGAFARLDRFYADGGDPSAVSEICSDDMATIRRFVNGLFDFGITLNGFFSVNRDLDALDPFNPEMPELITFNFENRPPIIQVLEIDGNEIKTPHEYWYQESSAVPLRPSERLFKVDLSRKKGDIVDAFRQFLGAVDYFRESDDVPPYFKENYAEWEQDNTRFRHEAWQQLRVWKLRRQRKTYTEIVKKTGLNLPAAKKAFTRAYELIEGRRYDPELFKLDYREIVSGELGRTCEACPLRGTCTELCPDVLIFVDQDQKPLSEMLL
ncbi:MAG: hypothetical protein ACOWWM_09475 [Desulfobacterales bacterium]